MSNPYPDYSNGVFTKSEQAEKLAELGWQEIDCPICGGGARAFPKPQQEPVAVYGYCPQCGAKGVMRERRPNGNDKCANGHTYPSSKSTPPQRTWVGLTDEEIDTSWRNVDYKVPYEQFRLDIARAVEAELKEKNT